MIWILLSLLITIIDKLTKYFVLQNIGLGEMIPVIDKFFYLTLHMNSGAAFSVLKDGRPFFLVITPIVSIVVIYILFKTKSKFLRLALGMILGGTIGNYIDRVATGEVTDFLLFYIGSYPFPVFNVADIALTCGTIMVAIYIIFIYKEPEKEEEKGADTQTVMRAQAGEELDTGIEAEVNNVGDSNKDVQ